VQRLDGMPLAIELAAARVEALGLGQLLDRLDDRLLVSANRAAPARQRSLDAAVDWSYQLLTAPEQRVFRNLSVFPGPFGLDAAEAAAMTLAAAVEFAVMMAGEKGPDAAMRPGLAKLSARERELVTLVARGRTDAQIAEQLVISVRTVRTHLDRIRDKSGCRRRADLTRLALREGII